MGGNENAAPCLLFFCLCFLYLSAGQVLMGQAGYRLEEGGRFVQTFRWEEQEDALYYEVEIAEQDGEGWREAVLERTGTASIEVSLPPGNYRYRVRVYDILERPAGTAEWIYFEVLQAKQPEIFRFNPEAFYLDEDLVWVLTVSGRNLTGEMEIYLEGRGGIIRPKSISTAPSENEARLIFG
jgi:hypothetical protein